MVLSDNLGIVLAKYFAPPTTSVENLATLTDSSGANFVCRVLGDQSSKWNASATTYTQIGKGLSPKTKQDISIEVPFGVAPESGVITAQAPAYVLGSGVVKQGTFITPLGENDSITEVVTYRRIQATNGSFHNTLFTADNINPAVPFLIGQAVQLEHSYQL